MFMKKRSLSVIGVMAIAMFYITSFAHAGVSEEFTARIAAVAHAGGEEMTEDIYVDITATIMFYNAYFSMQVEEGKMSAADMNNQLVVKMDEVYEAHGVTEEAYSNYNDEMMDNPEKYLSLMGAITERVDEIAEKYKPK